MARAPQRRVHLRRCRQVRHRGSRSKTCGWSTRPAQRSSGVALPQEDAAGDAKLSGMLTVVLLFVSNTFMTVAWYGHLKHRSAPLVEAILVSWLIAGVEYAFQVPANRIGY